MALLDKLSHLEGQIDQYLKLHGNPHDTSSRNDIANKLTKLLSLLKRATHSSGDSVTDSKAIGGSVGKNGDNNIEDVKVVQLLFNKVGYSFQGSGQCGPKTIKAIEETQAKVGEEVNGLLQQGSKAWEALKSGTIDDSKDEDPTKGEEKGIEAQVTRYGYTTDPYANSNDLNAIGNNNNKLTAGLSVALSPELYVELGIGRKSGAYIYVTFENGSTKKFQTADQTAKGLRNYRVDFFDPNGTYKSIDGQKCWVKTASSGGSTDTVDPNTSTDEDGGNTSKRISASVGKGGNNKVEDVKAVQTLLEIVVDGDCGPKTKRAIKKFQREHDIKPVTGLIEPNSITWAKLTGDSSNASDDPSSTTDEDKNDNNTSSGTTINQSVGTGGANEEQDVRVIQNLLNNNGYELAVNGQAEEDTLKNIKDFQRRKQQNPTGLINPNDETFRLLDGQTIEEDKPEPTVAVNDTLQKSVGLGGQNETADVALVQQLLRDDWGYDIPVDGDPQDSTIQAIRQFQHRFAGMVNSQDARVDPNGTTIKYLTGVLKPTEGYSDDGIIGGVETALEEKMADFTKAFSGVRVEVRPDEWVAVRPPYHINLGHRKRSAEQERQANPPVGRIARSLGFGGHVGKATLVQIEDFLNQCLAANLVPEAKKTSKGLNEFLDTYGISMDCSGLAIQAANFLLQDDLERNKNNQSSEEVNITNTAGIQNHPKINNPTNLRAGDMMVNYKREGTSTYHVRIVVDVDVEEDHVAFTTVESGSSTTLGDGGNGVGQRRWKCPNKINYDNLKILMGNDWQTAGRSDQAYTYVRMRQLENLES